MTASDRSPSARLRAAIQCGNVAQVRRLLAKVETWENTEPVSRFTSLAYAAQSGHYDICELLLELGHDRYEQSKDAEQNTILHIAAAAGHPRIIELYHSHFPFMLDWPNFHGLAPLHVAAEKGFEDVGRLLLDLGADIDLPDLKGNLPLHYASGWGHLPLVTLFIERGCQFAARNNNRFSASDYAYSFAVQHVLQEQVRNAFEIHKRARKQSSRNARLAEGRAITTNHPVDTDHRHSTQASSSSSIYGNGTSARARGGSGGSRKDQDADSVHVSGVIPAPPRSISLPSVAAAAGGSQANGPSSNVGTEHSKAASKPPSSLRLDMSQLPRPIPFTPSSSSVTPSRQMEAGLPIPSPQLDPASASSVRKMMTKDLEAIAEFRERGSGGGNPLTRAATTTATISNLSGDSSSNMSPMKKVLATRSRSASGNGMIKNSSVAPPPDISTFRSRSGSGNTFITPLPPQSPSSSSREAQPDTSTSHHPQPSASNSHALDGPLPLTPPPPPPPPPPDSEKPVRILDGRLRSGSGESTTAPFPIATGGGGGNDVGRNHTRRESVDSSLASITRGHERHTVRGR